ncbi:MAG: chemotaxis protein CheW [Candidatus Hydrogenedentota bacterium]
MNAEAGRGAILEARAKSLRSPRAQPAPADEIEVLLFRTGAERYAIRAGDVSGIHRLADIAPVPGAPRAIRGVSLLGGEIITILDISILFSSQGRGLADQRHAIVVGRNARRIAILAAEVEGMCRVSLGALRKWPGRSGDGSEEDEGWIEGIMDEDRSLLRLPVVLKNIEQEVRNI